MDSLVNFRKIVIRGRFGGRVAGFVAWGGLGLMEAGAEVVAAAVEGDLVEVGVEEAWVAEGLVDLMRKSEFFKALHFFYEIIMNNMSYIKFPSK